jgi:hypothetical protein
MDPINFITIEFLIYIYFLYLTDVFVYRINDIQI